MNKFKIWLIKKINKKLESEIINWMVECNDEYSKRNNLLTDCINHALLHIPNNCMVNYPQMILENALRYTYTHISDDICTSEHSESVGKINE